MLVANTEGDLASRKTYLVTMRDTGPVQDQVRDVGSWETDRYFWLGAGTSAACTPVRTITYPSPLRNILGEN